MEYLKTILKDPRNKLIAVDLDWTLCKWEFRWWEPEPKPIQEAIDYINSLYQRWAHIIIYTARQPILFQETMAWLIRYWVMYHWIVMQQKPWADLYIDDKCLNIKDLISNK